MFITKIDGIEVLQDNDSILEIQNKSNDREDIKKGKNEQIDLGEGAKTLRTSFIINDDDKFDKIYKIITKKRTCTLTDKFLGDMKVFIKQSSIANSDKHLGYTRVSISFKINEEFNPKVNFKGAILNDIKTIEDNNKITYLNPSNILQNDLKGLVDKSLVPKDKDILSMDYDIKANETKRFIEVNNNIGNLGYSTDIIIPKIEKFDISDLLGTEKIINSNLNVNSIYFNNLVLIDLMNKSINTTKALEFEEISKTVLTVLNDNITLMDNILNPIDINIDFNSIKNDMLDFITNNSLGVVDSIILNKPVNINIWCYDYYGSLDRVEEIKRLNNTYIDMVTDKLLYYKKDA